MALTFLISDILYNSCSPTIPNVWHYKKGIEKILPDIFEKLHKSFNLINGRLSAQNMKENVLNLIKIWSKWSIFDDKFLFGLETTFLRKSTLKSQEIMRDKDNSMDPELKIYLNKTLEEIHKQMTLNSSYLEKQCRILGLSFCGGNEKEIISRILSYFENQFYKEREEKSKEIIIDDSPDKNPLIEYDNIINNLKQILNSLQKSYKKIDDNYIDGVKIDPIEYELFNLNKKIEVKNDIIENIDGEEIIEKIRNLDGEEILLQNENNTNNLRIDVEIEKISTEKSNKSEGNLIGEDKSKNEVNLKNYDYFDDIDGEPIDN